jgi:hypothetical protein
VRDAFLLMKESSLVREVQAFGDRLNVIVDDARRDYPAIAAAMSAAGIPVDSHRVISPSLENVFISLLTHNGFQEGAL